MGPQERAELVGQLRQAAADMEAEGFGDTYLELATAQAIEELEAERQEYAELLAASGKACRRIAKLASTGDVSTLPAIRSEADQWIHTPLDPPTLTLRAEQAEAQRDELVKVARAARGTVDWRLDKAIKHLGELRALVISTGADPNGSEVALFDRYQGWFARQAEVLRPTLASLSPATAALLEGE